MEIVDYKPPLAVMVLLDGSGSMQSVQGADGTTKFEGAKQGIVSALGAFSGRDYVGLMTLSETYDTVLPLTSAAQSEMIGKAVADAAPSGAATLFSGALAAAGQALGRGDAGEQAAYRSDNGRQARGGRLSRGGGKAVSGLRHYPFGVRDRDVGLGRGFVARACRGRRRKVLRGCRRGGAGRGNGERAALPRAYGGRIYALLSRRLRPAFSPFRRRRFGRGGERAGDALYPGLFLRDFPERFVGGGSGRGL